VFLVYLYGKHVDFLGYFLYIIAIFILLVFYSFLPLSWLGFFLSSLQRFF
jgi:hypothetical protein